MAETARAYCALIEAVEAADRSWLQRMARLLSRLHLAVEALDKPPQTAYQMLLPDLDARFELFTFLHQLIGAKERPWIEFELIDCLADDLTDIYCEMKHGLRLLDQDPVAASDSWRSGYQLHWGQHLVDAVRHLYTLTIQAELGGGEPLAAGA